MRGRKTQKLDKMYELAEILKEKEMTEQECAKFVGLSQQNFCSFITSMSERYLVYEYVNKSRKLVYGMLK